MAADPEQKKKMIMGAVAVVAILGVGAILANYYGLFGSSGAGVPKPVTEDALAQTPEGKKELEQNQKVMTEIQKTAKTGGS